MTEVMHREEIVARHVHHYDLSATRPADTFATAAEDAESFWGQDDDNLPLASVLYSETTVQMFPDPETGKLSVYWIQAGEENDAPFESSADSVATHHLHIYTIDSPAASMSAVRSVMKKAENDAKDYAKQNDLIYKDDMIGVIYDEESISILWSTETE